MTYLTKARQGPPVEGPITPAGFPWGVTYLAKAKQTTEMSSAGYYIHLELYFMIVCTFVSMPPHHIFLHAMFKTCYMDFFLCRLIYAYPYTISVTYYDTLVPIMKNYYSHQTSELGTSYGKCQADLMLYCFLHFSCVILFCNNKN